MSTASLPLPAGARAAGPTSRSVVEAWAAPRAADLVLDPWAAPVGPPIAAILLSPWPAPNPTMRLVSMPPPAALVSMPELSARTAELAQSTEAALAAIAAASPRLRPVGPALPAPDPATLASATAPGTSPVSAPDTSAAPADAAPTGRSIMGLRARMWAMIAGGAAATAGAVALVATVF